MEFIDQPRELLAWASNRDKRTNEILAARIFLRIFPVISLQHEYSLYAEYLALYVRGSFVGSAAIFDEDDSTRGILISCYADVTILKSHHPMLNGIGELYDTLSAFMACIGSTGNGAQELESTIDAMWEAVPCEKRDFQSTRTLFYTALNNDIPKIERTGPESLTNSPLWIDCQLPKPIELGWQHFKNDVAKIDNQKSFWISWYQSLLDGNFQYNQDLRKVSHAPINVWQQGLPNVDDLIRRTQDVEIQRSQALAEAKSRIRDISDQFSSISMTIEGLSRQIDKSTQDYLFENKLNALPTGLEVLHRIPPILNAISIELRSAKSHSDASGLESVFEQLFMEMYELRESLSKLNEQSKLGQIEKAFLQATGKSLGDWKLWGAVLGAFYVVLGSDSIGSVVTDVSQSLREIFQRQ